MLRTMLCPQRLRDVAHETRAPSTVEWFTAILNPPETAILAVGQIVDTPVGHEGNVVLRPMMQLTLSVDHRVVDGAGAARFLAEVKRVLENPYLLI